MQMIPLGAPCCYVIARARHSWRTVPSPAWVVLIRSPNNAERQVPVISHLSAQKLEYAWDSFKSFFQPPTIFQMGHNCIAWNRLVAECVTWRVQEFKIYWLSQRLDLIVIQSSLDSSILYSKFHLTRNGNIGDNSKQQKRVWKSSRIRHTQDRTNTKNTAINKGTYFMQETQHTQQTVTRTAQNQDKKTAWM